MGWKFIGILLDGGKDSATFKDTLKVNTRTDAPVHLLSGVPISAVLAFPGKVLGREEGRVHLDAGEDQQEGRVRVPGKQSPTGHVSAFNNTLITTKRYCRVPLGSSETAGTMPRLHLVYSGREGSLEGLTG